MASNLPSAPLLLWFCATFPAHLRLFFALYWRICQGLSGPLIGSSDVQRCLRRLAALNVTADQIVGKTLYEYELAEELTVDANAPVVLAHRRGLGGETAVYEQAGPNFIVQAPYALRDSDSRIVGCIGICQDVTARKRAEEALRESEQRYRAIIEETTEMIARFTPELILTYVNEAYCRFVGSTRENLIGKNLLCLVAEEHRR